MLKSALLCALMLFAAVSVSAAPITSGSITVQGLMTIGDFVLAGEGFSIIGGFDDGNWPSARIVSPGHVLEVYGMEVGLGFTSGSARVGSTTYSPVYWGDLDAARGSQFELTGPPVVIGAVPGTYSSTFTFSGSLCGVQGGGAPVKPCVVDLKLLEGTGTVEVTVAADGRVREAVYTFASPEPATMALTGLGLAVAALLARRRG